MASVLSVTGYSAAAQAAPVVQSRQKTTAAAPAPAPAAATATAPAQLSATQLLEEPLYELMQQARAGSPLLAIQVLAQEQAANAPLGASTPAAGPAPTPGSGAGAINLLA